MRIDFLKTFMTVVNKGSLKRAAEAMGTSVSTVSFQIKAIEEFYGAKLFKRNVNGIELTEEGKIVFKNIEYILGSIEETKRLLLNVRSKSISLASGMCGMEIVFSIQSLLKAKYPDVEVKVELKGAHDCVRDVIDGKVDFAIVGDILDDHIEEDGLHITELGKDYLVLIVPPDHPLAKKEEVRLKDVLKEPLIMLNESYGITTSTLKALKRHGIRLEDLNITCVMSDFYSKLNAVSSGMGVAITSFIATCKASEVGLIRIRRIVDFEDERNVYFVANKFAMESEKLREYADFIVKNCKKFFNDIAETCKALR